VADGASNIVPFWQVWVPVFGRMVGNSVESHAPDGLTGGLTGVICTL